MQHAPATLAETTSGTASTLPTEASTLVGGKFIPEGGSTCTCQYKRTQTEIVGLQTKKMS